MSFEVWFTRGRGHLKCVAETATKAAGEKLARKMARESGAKDPYWRVEKKRTRNPIRRVDGGWQWGHHGHVYPTREGAIRQMDAAFAHGYRGKGHSRSHNPMNRIEKSAFRRGEYVGYADGPWEIRKARTSYGNWAARKKDSPNTQLFAYTLQDMNRQLEEWERAHKRESNPGRGSVHTAKWDRCFKEVRAKGGARSAAAVCTAALGEKGSIKPGHRRRDRNPLPKTDFIRRTYYVVRARKGHEVWYLTRGDKLMKREPHAARFRTIGEAQAAAVAHLNRYAHSRQYKFEVTLAY